MTAILFNIEPNHWDNFRCHMHKNCFLCNKLFTITRKDRKFCSSVCGKKQWKIDNRNPESLPRNRYASVEEREDARRKRWRERRLKKRFKIFLRDGFKCAYCGKKPPEIILEIDHIIPKSKGGKFEPNNLISACRDCNNGKKDILLNEFESPVIIEKSLQLNTNK